MAPQVPVEASLGRWFCYFLMNSKKALGLTILFPPLARADEVRITVISLLGMSLFLAQDCRCGMSVLRVVIRGERRPICSLRDFLRMTDQRHWPPPPTDGRLGVLPKVVIDMSDSGLAQDRRSRQTPSREPLTVISKCP
jgi:hypothetical protein